MPLKDCPECSGQVSTEADRCPHCGYPVNPAKSDVYQFRLRVLKNARMFFTVIGVLSLVMAICGFTFPAVLAALSCLMGSAAIRYKIKHMEKNGNNTDN